MANFLCGVCALTLLVSSGDLACRKYIPVISFWKHGPKTETGNQLNTSFWQADRQTDKHWTVGYTAIYVFVSR